MGRLFELLMLFWIEWISIDLGSELENWVLEDGSFGVRARAQTA
jgi:hypothetical protein